MSDTLPKTPKSAPYAVDVEAGKSYFWCSCGLSANQPFCDGSHKGTGFAPLKFEATQDQKKFFCGCKQSKHGAFCDGAHNKL